jgi:hypothetical protein
MTTQENEDEYIAIPKTLWLAIVEELGRRKERIKKICVSAGGSC